MTQDPNIGRVLEGKYKLIRVLGTGGMGTVYEATHLLIKRRLAVKLLHAEYAKEELFATRFKREAQTASAIGHDHIVDITDMGTTDDGELFIVMEYLEGADLATILQKEPLMSPKRACHIMIQVLSALEAAHAKGIIHRDLKPANIFIIHHLESDYYVKLVDFGISKRHHNDTDMTRGLTKTGELLGTPSFMSPEQARGEGTIDAKSDIFSAGMILYKLLTGNVPFEDKALTMLLLKILNDTPPHPCEVNPNVPKPLGDAVLKAMEKEPIDRFKDVASFRRVLQRYSPDTASKTGLKVTQYNAGAPPTYPGEGDPVMETTPLQLVMSDNGQPKKRKRIVGVLAVIMLAAFVAVGALYSQSKTGIKAGAKPTPVKQIPEKQPLEKAPPPPPKITPPAPSTVEINVAVAPAIAEILLDGKRIGTGSATHKAQTDATIHELTVSAPGYQPYRAPVAFDKDIAFEITLAKEEEPTRVPEGKRERRKGKNRTISDDESPKEVTQEKSGDDPAPSSPPEEPADPAPSDTTSKRPLRAIDEVNPW